MKISISKALYTHVLSSFTGFVAGSAVYVQELNPDLESTSEAKSFFKNVPFYSKIEDVANRVGSLTRTEEEIILEVSDEFLTDVVDLTIDSAKATLPIVTAYLKHVKDFAGKVENLSDKWFPVADKEKTSE